MLFADGFWEMKTISDVVTVVGLPLTILSIWLTVKYARRDIEQRIKVAQQQTIDRLARGLLHPDVTETGRYLREAREACRAKRWERALDRCEQAKYRIPTFSSLPGLEDDDRAKLQRAADQLRDLVKQIEEVAVGTKRKELTAPKLKDLDDLITTLVTIEGKLRASGLR
jgi:hypothetical protein